jgi:hypothetical protein
MKNILTFVFVICLTKGSFCQETPAIDNLNFPDTQSPENGRYVSGTFKGEVRSFFDQGISLGNWYYSGTGMNINLPPVENIRKVHDNFLYMNENSFNKNFYDQGQLRIHRAFNSGLLFNITGDYKLATFGRNRGLKTWNSEWNLGRR